jgi:hypothetical protein
MEMLKEMPKIANCLKCLKLRYSIDFIKLGAQGMLIYGLSDSGFSLSQSLHVHKKDGAQRHNNFSHFRHFSAL